MSHRALPRYTDVAVLLHWLIAVLIIGLLIVGKYMSGLGDSDPLRYALTQWHKSLGITVLLLSLLRLLWRFGHKPPRLPDALPHWQRQASGLTHGLLYLLILLVPLSGWIMVSASPLGLETRLFNIIPLPHLPPFAELANKDALADRFRDLHEYAANLMLLLVLLHVAAALKHQFHDRDDILSRMLPVWTPRFRALFSGLAVVVIGSAALLTVYQPQSAAMRASGSTAVNFIAQVTGDDAAGSFTESTVTAVLSDSAPSRSSLQATVMTASIVSDDAQISATLPGGDWFDSENFPEARFESTAIERLENGDFQITGQLNLKGKSMQIQFPMQVSTDNDIRSASGRFTIDRREFDIGLESQADDSFVGFGVDILFQFDLES